MNDVIKHKIKHNAHRALVSVKWVIFAILVGGIVGLCGTAFYFCLTFVTVLRGQNPWLLYLLPVGGLIIVGAYHLLHDDTSCSTRRLEMRSLRRRVTNTARSFGERPSITLRLFR